MIDRAAAEAEAVALTNRVGEAVRLAAADHGLGMPWMSLHLRMSLASSVVAMFEPLGDGLWRLRESAPSP